MGHLPPTVMKRFTNQRTRSTNYNCLTCFRIIIIISCSYSNHLWSTQHAFFFNTSLILIILAASFLAISSFTQFFPKSSLKDVSSFQMKSPTQIQIPIQIITVGDRKKILFSHKNVFQLHNFIVRCSPLWLVVIPC